MVLVGRRHLRSNNSWMHNLDALVKGKARCTVHVHPDDAARLGLADGEPAEVRSRAGAIEVAGRGHRRDDARRRQHPPRLGPRRCRACSCASPRAHAGVNSNLLADEPRVDPLSGNAVLNGIPVELAPVPARETVPA